MSKKMLQKYFVIIIICFSFARGQIIFANQSSVDEVDTYFFEIIYQYKNNSQLYELNASNIESGEYSETSEKEKGEKIGIPELGDILKLKGDDKTLKKVDFIQINSDDDCVIDNINTSLDGTFKMPAADVYVRVVLSDSDE